MFIQNRKHISCIKTLSDEDKCGMNIVNVWEEEQTIVILNNLIIPYAHADIWYYFLIYGIKL